MTRTTLSSQEISKDIAMAKNAAKSGPVFITDHDKTAHVLLSIEEYQRLTTSKHRNIVEALSMPGIADIEIEYLHSRKLLPLPANFK